MTSDVSNTNANSRRYQFHSNEAGTAAKRPVLSVTYDPNEAFGPEPMDGEVQVDPDTDLSWFPGTVTSVTNTVYIGTDPDPFTNPDFTIPVAKGAADPSQIILNISPQYPDGLASNTEYYWGVNNGAIDSEIWVFTTQLASDLNGDGVVNLLDFALLSQGWQTIYDINDLKAMTAVWLFGT
jgi:hypothetical protein